MPRTLLQMVNSVLEKLREDHVSSLSTEDLRQATVVSLINEAAGEVLGERQWPFDRRDDGLVLFPASVTDSAATTSLNIASLIATVAPADRALLANQNGTARPVLRAQVTNDTQFPDLSYRVTSVALGVGNLFVFSLEEPYRGDSLNATASIITFCHEMVLPATVRQVLSVQNPSLREKLRLVDRNTAFDTFVPTPTIEFSDAPSVIYAGAYATSTAIPATFSGESGDQAAVRRLCMMIWPIPSSALQIAYSYVVQHPELSAATDTFDGVPDSIVHLIEWVAYQKALMGTIQDNERKGRTLLLQNEQRLRRAWEAAQTDPLRRRIPSVFGSTENRNPRRAWESQEVPSP